MKPYTRILFAVALALAGVACGPPRTRSASGVAYPLVSARWTGTTASESPDPERRSEGGAESSDRGAAADTEIDRTSHEAPEDLDADGAEEAAFDPEAGDVAPHEAPEARGAPTRVQAVPSRLPTPLDRQSRVFAPEIDNIPDPSWVEPTVLVLARICVSEAGWEGTRDCAGIFQVLRNVRRNDETLMGAMRRASRVVSEMWEPTTARHRWLVHLDLEGSEPENFPPEADWEAHYRHRWMQVLDHARALVEGRAHAHPCPGAVIAWGGDMDDYLALQRNLVRVDCGETANTFWKRPGG